MSDKCSAVAEMTVWPQRTWGSWVPVYHNVAVPRPTSVPSGILIHPAVWPQYTNVTERTKTGQRSDSIGRTVLQTVAQKTNYNTISAG